VQEKKAKGLKTYGGTGKKLGTGGTKKRQKGVKKKEKREGEVTVKDRGEKKQAKLTPAGCPSISGTHLQTVHRYTSKVGKLDFKKNGTTSEEKKMGKNRGKEQVGLRQATGRGN